jgi:hypothetical protein
MVANQGFKRWSLGLMTVLGVCLLASSLPAISQTRACVIDERSGALRCGRLVDERGRPILEYAPPAVVNPVFGNDRRDDRMSREQAQDGVNRLFREVLGRTADYASLRNFADQVVDGRDLSDLRIELATSPEAREAIKRIYREVLRREADPSGLESAVNELRGGQSLSQIRAMISRSPEARNRR